MLDKVLATLSIVLFIAFVGIVVIYVKEVDLTIIIVAVVIIAAYDFWKALRTNGKKGDAAKK